MLIIQLFTTGRFVKAWTVVCLFTSSFVRLSSPSLCPYLSLKIHYDNHWFVAGSHWFVAARCDQVFPTHDVSVCMSLWHLISRHNMSIMPQRLRCHNGFHQNRSPRLDYLPSVTLWVLDNQITTIRKKGTVPKQRLSTLPSRDRVAMTSYHYVPLKHSPATGSSKDVA